MIIYADVVCDLLHEGHINFFKQIKTIYPHSKIIVGLMSDEQCTNYKRSPVFNIDQRFTILSSIKYIDSVIKNAPMPITSDFIEMHSIGLVIHGDDISEESEDYWYKEAKLVGKFQKIPYTHTISTTKIIEKIRSGLFV